MLGKEKGRRNHEPAEMPATVATTKSQVRTVIGQNISITGDIKGKEDLEIQGTISGSIELPANHLTVGPNGKVEAEIKADNVTISGRLSGNITARGKVLITREADFSGEIKAKSIAVEDGAYLKAVIELEREDRAAGPKPMEPLTPAASAGPKLKV